MTMKRSGIYVPQEVTDCWEIYARFRGGRMSRNNVLEELTFFLLCPDLLTVSPEVISKAIESTCAETKRQNLGQVTDGNW